MSSSNSGKNSKKKVSLLLRLSQKPHNSKPGDKKDKNSVHEKKKTKKIPDLFFLKSFVDKLNSEFKIDLNSKKKESIEIPLELAINNLPPSKNNYNGSVLKIVISTVKEKKKVYEIEKNVSESLNKLVGEKSSYRELKAILNIEVEENLIIESKEMEFVVVATLNGKWVSNELKIKKDKSRCDIFKLKKGFGKFTKSIFKEMKEDIAKKEEEVKKKRKELKDKLLAKFSKKEEITVTLKKGRYKMIKEDGKNIFVFPIKVHKFIMYGSSEYLCFVFYDKDGKNFFVTSRHFSHYDFSKKDVYDMYLKINEDLIVYVDFPVRIDIASRRHFAKSIVLKSVELNYTNLIEVKKKKNMKFVLSELMENKFKIKRKEKTIFSINLNDLPFEMIHEILSFLPLKDVVFSSVRVSKYFKTITNYHLEGRTKKFLLEKSNIGKKILQFMFKQSSSWREVYTKLKAISKVAITGNLAFQTSHVFKYMKLHKDTSTSLWLDKDTYDDSAPVIYYGRKCF